jgi:lipid-A-disaccharide synthase
MNKPLKLMLIAGEASGDKAASSLIKEIKEQHINLEIIGIAGRNCIQEGLTSIYSLNKISVMGFFDVITSLKHIIQAMSVCRKKLRTYKPDYLILVDYPGFNLKLARYAKKLNIPVFYYISPKVWAWKQSRINLIQKYVSHMAVILPFEVPIYQQKVIPVTLVTHPSLEYSKATKTKLNTCNSYNIDPEKQIICLMPGSRTSEIKYNFPTIVETCKLLLQDNCDYQFVLPIASTIDITELKKYISHKLFKHITLIPNDQYNAIAASDVVIAVSGTATLEVSLMQKPLCVIYKTSTINYAIAKRVLLIPYISLCNLIVGENIVTELIQHNATPHNIAAWVQSIESNIATKNSLIANLAKVRSTLTNNESAISAGKCFLNFIS